MQVVFVTGTDTGVGKSWVAAALIRRARAAGIDARGFKPVASGAERTADGWRNEDALALLEASGEDAGDPAVYVAANPYCFEPPIAPHLAARFAGVPVEAARLDAAVAARGGDLVVIEGAGGWHVPLSDALRFSDWVAGHAWPVLLVVGLRLGCLNHAQLTAEAVSRRTPLLGWVGNTLPPGMDYLDENLDTLGRTLATERLGVLPAGLDPNVAAASLDWPKIQGRLGAAASAH